MLEKISNLVLDLASKLGSWTIPAAIAAVIVLVLFASNSYRLFKFVLPILAAVAGGYLGAVSLGKLVYDSLPGITNIINPVYLVGAIVGIICGLICAKFHRFSMLVIGAALGYTIISRFVKDVVLSFQITQDTINATDHITHVTVGMIICIVCLILTAIVLVKFFKPLYIVLTSVGCIFIAFVLSSVLIFVNTAIANIALIAGLILGLLVGIRVAVIQFEKMFFES